MSQKTFGKYFEDWVCDELERQEYRILTQNFHSPFGEIDIIAIEDKTLVFVEVKTRSSQQFGQPYEAVNQKKLEKITKTGNYYRNALKKSKLPEATRIDVASILLTDGQVTEFRLMKNVTR